MEYALITGLDCSEDYHEVRETIHFRERHFSGNENVHIEEVAKKLKKLRRTPEGAIILEIKIIMSLFCCCCPLADATKYQASR